jgi:hypothetical protein
MRAPVAIRLWGRGWWLIGNGPSYLLFRAEEGRIMHLTTLLPRNLRAALKGYQAIKNARLTPLVRALSLINTRLLYSPFHPTEDSIRCAKNTFIVLRTIERLIYHFADEKAFEDALARFASNLRAARRLTNTEIEFAGGSEFVLSTDLERAKFWLTDSFGREVLISDCADIAEPHTFKCVIHSPIARAIAAIWNRERKSFGDRASCLYYIPTRKEVREELALDEPAITKLCRAEGLDWLPRAKTIRVKIPPPAARALQLSLRAQRVSSRSV